MVDSEADLSAVANWRRGLPAIRGVQRCNSCISQQATAASSVSAASATGSPVACCGSSSRTASKIAHRQREAEADVPPPRERMFAALKVTRGLVFKIRIERAAANAHHRFRNVQRRVAQLDRAAWSSIPKRCRSVDGCRRRWCRPGNSSTATGPCCPEPYKCARRTSNDSPHG